jgi:hypothetical protein
MVDGWMLMLVGARDENEVADVIHSHFVGVRPWRCCRGPCFFSSLAVRFEPFALCSRFARSFRTLSSGDHVPRGLAPKVLGISWPSLVWRRAEVRLEGGPGRAKPKGHCGSCPRFTFANFPVHDEKRRGRQTTMPGIPLFRQKPLAAADAPENVGGRGGDNSTATTMDIGGGGGGGFDQNEFGGDGGDEFGMNDDGGGMMMMNDGGNDDFGFMGGDYGGDYGTGEEDDNQDYSNFNMDFGGDGMMMMEDGQEPVRAAATIVIFSLFGWRRSFSTRGDSPTIVSYCLSHTFCMQ